MVKHLLGPLFASALAVSGAAHAGDFTEAAAAMLVARDVCSPAPISERKMDELINLAAIGEGKTVDEAAVEIGTIAAFRRENLLAHGSVDAFCTDVRAILKHSDS